MPGMTHSNEFIARDEGMHVRFAAQVYRELLTRDGEAPPVEQMVREAVALEIAFFSGERVCDVSMFLAFPLTPYGNRGSAGTPVGDECGDDEGLCGACSRRGFGTTHACTDIL